MAEGLLETEVASVGHKGLQVGVAEEVLDMVGLFPNFVLCYLLWEEVLDHDIVRFA